jgi:hypothetical protein
MSWPGFEQILWQIQHELGEIRGLLYSNRQEYTERLDRIEERLNKDRLHWRDILPSIMPALFGVALLIAVIMGKVTLLQAVSQLFGR